MPDKPEPSAPETDSPPPSYSSLMASQSQGTYVPVPMESSQPAPYPTTVPVQQDTTSYYNPVNQVPMENGKPMSQPGFNITPYASTTYAPIVNEPPVVHVITPNRTIVASSQATNSRSKRSRYLTVLAAIGAIFIMIGVGSRMHQRTQERQLQQKRAHKVLRRQIQEELGDRGDFNDYDHFRREFEDPVMWNSGGNRYKRSITSVLPNRDYDFEALNRAAISFVKQLPQLKNLDSRPTVYDADHRFGHSLFKRNTMNKRLQGHVKRRYVKPNAGLRGTPITSCS
ncbi:uncharacterized protein LOC124174777 [Neodiprion fabricii]|uniref:uncharacterized protein LOC124174777 n=1 Tax=Neodiprion fabricii TaxID=2872261 RepID=UPI001ED916D7|nr:uncharacterized protein LOC124174777 [Neodiprion fabricii]